MEAMQQLSNESFSYRWLINVKSSSDTLDDSLRFSIDGGSFIEMDPNLIISMRWTSKETHDFHFQQLPSSHGVVSADQIFSNGLLLPLVPPADGGATATLSRSLSLDSSESLLSRSNRHQSRNFKAAPGRSLSTPCSPSNATAAAMAAKSKLPSPKKILLKYLSFMLPLYKKVKGGLKLTTSPRKSNATKEIRSRNVVFDVCTETSIHDAVLYCKKSYYWQENQPNYFTISYDGGGDASGLSRSYRREGCVLVESLFPCPEFLDRILFRRVAPFESQGEVVAHDALLSETTMALYRDICILVPNEALSIS